MCLALAGSTHRLGSSRGMGMSYLWYTLRAKRPHPHHLLSISSPSPPCAHRQPCLENRRPHTQVPQSLFLAGVPLTEPPALQWGAHPKRAAVTPQPSSPTVAARHRLLRDVTALILHLLVFSASFHFHLINK